MERIRQQPVLASVAGVVLGLVLGLIIGWGIWPVQWEGGGPQHLAPVDQEIYLLTMAELYERDINTGPRVQQALAGWGEAVPTICALANRRPADAARLNSLAAVLNNGQGCAAAAPASEAAGGSSLGTALIIILLLLVGAGVVFYLMANRRTSQMERARPTYDDVPTVAPETDLAPGVVAPQATPVARFRTTFVRGHDTYDDSYSIESAEGDFLGECGVGISESIGSDTPRAVTALEVWLFDKNDIRTVTKVIMSDHAFFDDGFKAKLAPKGEPVLAREHETIVLETASLIVNAEITDMEYGATADLPQDSYFERMTVELSAWSKEGDFDEPDIQSRIDEMLDY